MSPAVQPQINDSIRVTHTMIDQRLGMELCKALETELNRKLVEPFLDRLQESRLNDQQKVLVDILRANIAELTSPFASHFSGKLVRLTPAEMQVANLVKQGKRTKEIAAIMHLSPGTISIHRKNIRKKLELTHQKTNLQTALSVNI